MNAPFPDWLERSDLFRGLEPRTFDALLKAAATRSVPARLTLLKQGDASEWIFVVTHGRFKMSTLSPEGMQKTMRYMDPGDVIGCAAVFGGFPYPATATAVTASSVVYWSARQFRQLLETEPQLATNTLAIIGARAGGMMRRLRESHASSVEQRIARSLSALLQHERARRGEAEHPVTLRISRQELAEFSDTTLFSASRTISAWKRNGIVAGGRGYIRVLDTTRLSQLAAPGS